MATEIEHDAGQILSLLAAAPRNEYVAASEIAGRLALSADRVNDATTLLVESGLVEWNQVLGTAPFDFGDAMITPRGRNRLQASTDAIGSTHDNRQATPPLLVFVSHASEDVELARRVVVLISTAFSLPAATIRCTSVDGYRLPAGANIDQQLRREVHDAVAFIGIISPESLRSMFVLFELGARWGASRNLIPLIAHGVPGSSITGPLAGLNALRADSSGQLHQLIHDLGNQLGISPQSPAVFDRALHDVLASAPQMEPPPVSVVSLSPRQTDETQRVLHALANDDGQFADDLAQQLGLSATRTQAALESLRRSDLVESHRAVDRPPQWHVTEAGRRYLVDHGLV